MVHIPRLALLLLALLLPAAPAGAVTISAVGQTFSVLFGGNVNGSPVPGLTASADFTVVAFGAGTLTLDITLTNTADAAIWQSVRVSALGFDASLPLAGASVAGGGLFSNAVVDGALPNGFGAVDVCIGDNANACQGGQNGGVQLGQSGTTQLTLQLTGLGSAVDLSNFGVRYQSLTSAQLGLRDDSGTGGPTPGIPEPGAMLVFGLGLGIAGASGALRRRA